MNIGLTDSDNDISSLCNELAIQPTYTEFSIIPKLVRGCSCRRQH